MFIGIDASRAQVEDKTGTENYSAEIIKALAKIDRRNNYRLYLRGKRIAHSFHSSLPKNFDIKIIPWPRFWTQGGLALEVLKNPPDVLFIPAHTLPIIRPRRLKTIVTIHDLGAEFLPGYHKAWQREYLLFSTKYAVKNATALIAVSQATKNDLIKKLGADKDKIFVVYEGVDHEKFAPSRSVGKAFGGVRPKRLWRVGDKMQKSKVKNEKTLRKYGIKSDFFLFVGTIQPRKNLERLIEAFANLVKSEEGRGERKKINSSLVPAHLSLVLAGRRGWLSDEIYEAPRRFGVEDRVRFPGYIPKEDLVVLYSKCTAFVLPSLIEGFGLPALEAMACGAKVVLSQTSSLPEVGGEAAIYVDPYDVKSIAAGLEKGLLEGDALQKLVVERAKLFSWDKCARETLKVLEKVHPADI